MPVATLVATAAAGISAGGLERSAMNLAYNLIRTSQAYPHRPVVRLDETVLSYADLDEGSARVAGLLRERGLRAGDRVAVMLPNVPSSRSSTTACCGPAASSSR